MSSQTCTVKINANNEVYIRKADDYLWVYLIVIVIVISKLPSIVIVIVLRLHTITQLYSLALFVCLGQDYDWSVGWLRLIIRSVWTPYAQPLAKLLNTRSTHPNLHVKVNANNYILITSMKITLVESLKEICVDFWPSNS